MDRSRVAEFVLSWVLPVERAAAVAGDFAEEAERRGGVWFWSSVVRTFASGLARPFQDRPLTMFWTGVIGCLLIWPVQLLVAGVLGQLRLQHVINPDVADAILGVLFVVWRVIYGRLLVIARPGVGIAPAVAVALIGWLCLTAIVTLDAPRHQFNITSGVLNDVLLFAGAAWERNRDVRQWRAADG